jgi:hypothetical protein
MDQSVLKLFNVMKPVFISEHKELNIQMSLEDYLMLRMHELSANELRFPGYCKNLLKKIDGFFKKLVGGVLILIVGIYKWR